MTTVFFDKNKEDIRKELIDTLSKNEWCKNLAYNWDEDKETPIDYDWHILTKDGYRNILFGEEDFPNEFNSIKVESWSNVSVNNSERFLSKRTAFLKFNFEDIESIYIDHCSVKITLKSIQDCKEVNSIEII